MDQLSFNLQKRFGTTAAIHSQSEYMHQFADEYPISHLVQIYSC